MRLTLSNFTLSFDVPELDALEAKVDQINQSLIASLTQGANMSAELDSLTAQVHESAAVEASAIILIQGLADQLRAIANDPAAITALADQLNASEQALSAAIVANTPAAP